MVKTLPPLTLQSPLAEVPKVRAPDLVALRRLGIETVRDLLLNLPHGWESFQSSERFSPLEPGSHVRVVGRLASIEAGTTSRRRMRLTQAILEDSTGARIRLVWFNQPFRAQQLARGDSVVVAGKVRASRLGLVLQNPHVERVGDSTSLATNRVRDLMPKYRLTGRLTSGRVAAMVAEVLPLADEFEDPIPAPVRERRGLMTLAEAVRRGHRPADLGEWQAARDRLAFGEILELQLAFLVARRRLVSEHAIPIPFQLPVIETFKRGLGFELTHAQRQAAWDIFKDMDGPVPMNRLLNGDVGSGKTAVAAAAVAMAHAAGRQSVVMAPTEILARQHLAKFRAYLEDSFGDLKVELLVGGLPAAERRRVLTAAAAGHSALVVGTHALIEDSLELPNLGLAIVDEQHRFGTRQREQLRSKGRGQPHFLAMTATPIPRTLVLALYGEMSSSVLDELPPGRQQVRTSVLAPDQRDSAYTLTRQEVAQGHQVFIICPLVEESEVLETRAATVEYERLRREVFPDLRLGLVHGRLKEKDEVMRRFAAGDVDVLVATAVIEVGVDVPNATLMVIEGADRFGLAQLHQFRGRVGRGSAPSQCLLCAEDPSPEIEQRLKIMERVKDGFRLAELDLELRGAGELVGARQHGVSDAAMQAMLHPQLLGEARAEAELLLAETSELDDHPELRGRVIERLSSTSLS